jgi:hypothetical protein
MNIPPFSFFLLLKVISPLPLETVSQLTAILKMGERSERGEGRPFILPAKLENILVYLVYLDEFCGFG